MNKKLLRKKLALMLATLKKKRKYYTEVECLELTGTQGIDTGISGDLNTSYEIIAKSTQTGTAVAVLFGARSSASSNNISTLYAPDSTNVVNDFGNYTRTRQSYIPSNMSNKLKFYNSKNKRSVTDLDTGDYSEVTTTYSTAFTTPNNLHIGLKTSGFVDAMVSFSGYVYACKVWDNGVLVRDFIPVLDWDMTPCMYDKISGQLFYNAGTGNFIAGREIHPVDYLESTGTQYIDTGFTPNQNTKSVLDYKITTDLSSGFPLFGSRTSASSNGYSYQRYSSGVMGGQYGSNITQSNISPDLNRHIVIRDKNKIYLDGTEIASNPTTTFTCPGNLYLNAMNNNGTAAIQNVGVAYYGMKIYDNDVLVRDFIPAIDSDGVGYMFDRVNHTIYDNAGTGAFLYPAREVEYLEGTGTQCINTGLDYFADFEVGIQLRNNVSNKALGNGAFYCMQRQNSASPNWQFTNGSGNFYNSTIRITEHHVMKWKDNKVYSDDVLLTEFTKNTNAPNRMYLYSADGVNKYPNVIDFCKLWNPSDGTLVRDFIPCYKDGVLGMWDKVNGVLYPNAGTGTFSVGKIVEPEYE